MKRKKKPIKKKVNLFKSVVTLKVSEDGDKKIFGSGELFTKPDEVWIDELKQDNVENHYTIYTTNIIKLV